MWTCKNCLGKFSPDSPEAIEESKYIHFCSLECQENYNLERMKKRKMNKKSSDEDKEYRDKIFNYVAEHISKPNYGMIAQQAKAMLEEFELTYKNLWQVICYTETIEHKAYDTEYGLRQFDKYVMPCMRYIAEMQKVKKIKIKLKEEDKPKKCGRIIKPIFEKEEIDF